MSDNGFKFDDEALLLLLNGSVVFPHTKNLQLNGKNKHFEQNLSTIVGEKKRIIVLAKKSAGGFYSVGTVCEIVAAGVNQEDGFMVTLNGLYRAEIIEDVSAKKGGESVKIRPIIDVIDYQDKEIIDGIINIKILLLSIYDASIAYAVAHNEPADSLFHYQDMIDQCYDFAVLERFVNNFIAGYNIIFGSQTGKTVTVEERQELLEVRDIKTKLKKIIVLLDRFFNDITTLLGTPQSAFLPHLGQACDQSQQEGQVNDYGRLKEKYEKKKDKISSAAQKVIEAGLAKLKKTGMENADRSVTLNHIEYILDFPWGEYSRDPEDFNLVKESLNADSYGLDSVKKRITEFLAVKKLNPKAHGAILCLIGPPGVGKTALGQSIARAMNRKFIRLSVGGVNDEAAIRGHRRTYIGATAGEIVDEIHKCGAANPVFMLDEIDKMATDTHRGDPTSALLEALDPEQNFAFKDKFMDCPIDLSQVFFIATGNVAETIQRPLLDRMELIRLPGYTEVEKTGIAKQFLIPKQLKETGIENKVEVKIGDEQIALVIREYTNEAGVRELERKINLIFSKIAENYLSKKETAIALTSQNISEYLGKKKRRFDKTRPTEIGEAIGLAVTGEGRGDILFVQAELVPMGGRSEKLFSHTGNLMKVIEESEKVALSLVRKIMQEKKKNAGGDLLAGNLLHIHMPDGATPKDGPSAGITFVVALYSLLAEQPVKEGLVMTGEIDLKRNVKAVGGIKEKILAAVSSGAKEVLLSEENRDDFEELSDEVKGKIKPHFITKINEAIKIAFSD